MMGRFSVVVSIVVLIASLVGAGTVDNSLDGEDRVVLVAPVLAPPRDARTHVTDRARQFPILVLLAPQNPPDYVAPEPREVDGSPKPIYVQVS